MQSVSNWGGRKWGAKGGTNWQKSNQLFSDVCVCLCVMLCWGLNPRNNQALGNVSKREKEFVGRPNWILNTTPNHHGKGRVESTTKRKKKQPTKINKVCRKRCSFTLTVQT